MSARRPNKSNKEGEDMNTKLSVMEGNHYKGASSPAFKLNSPAWGTTMSFIRHYRFTLLGLAIAAVLALATSALPALATTARPGVTATCRSTPVFFGLHGMGEGPSSTISKASPEITSFDAAQNAISGAVLN
jgi:hypothetical protein